MRAHGQASSATAGQGCILFLRRKKFKACPRGMGPASQGGFRVMESSDDSLRKSSLQPRAEAVLL